MNIEKRGLHQTVKDVVIENTKMGEEKLLNDTTSYSIKDSKEFFNIVNNFPKVKIMGDYDVDGLTSSTIMNMLMKKLGKESSIRLPKRFSEGFGLSEKAVEEVEDELIITVDNGIAAIDAVKLAKDKGLTVIITDHHMPGEVLPEADLIIDPVAIKASATYNGYCGAGIAYKLAKSVLKGDDIKTASTIAAIGTIADSVPLVKDNRQIVKDGMNAIKEGFAPLGLRLLMEGLNIDATKIVVDDISYKMAAALNAPGRLYDDGANKSLKLLLCEDEEEGRKLVAEILDDNKKRQDLVNTAFTEIKEEIEDNNLHFSCPIVIEKDLHEGIVGIIAGKLTEKYKMPSIVLTKTDEGYKGSARAPLGYNLKGDFDTISSTNPDIFIRYGGHERAAGLTVALNHLYDFKEEYKALFPNFSPKSEPTKYDLEISITDVPEILDEMEKYGPFGEGNPAPVVYIRKFDLVPDKSGTKYSILGDRKSVIKFKGANFFSAVYYDGPEYYESIGKPDSIEMVGTLAHNYWNGWTYSQMNIIDYDGLEAEPISLEAFVRKRLAEMAPKLKDIPQDLTEAK